MKTPGENPGVFFLSGDNTMEETTSSGPAGLDQLDYTVKG